MTSQIQVLFIITLCFIFISAGTMHIDMNHFYTLRANIYIHWKSIRTKMYSFKTYIINLVILIKGYDYLLSHVKCGSLANTDWSGFNRLIFFVFLWSDRLHIRVPFEYCTFLHDRPWILPWITSISNELDITIHVIPWQLSGHCDVISNQLWRHQQNENRATETRGRCVKIIIFIVIYGFVMLCKK